MAHQSPSLRSVYFEAVNIEVVPFEAAPQGTMFFAFNVRYALGEK